MFIIFLSRIGVKEELFFMKRLYILYLYHSLLFINIIIIYFIYFSYQSKPNGAYNEK